MLLKLITTDDAIKDYQDLSATKTYQVLGIASDDFRIINDYGRPFLYPADIFIVVDTTMPSDWVVWYGEAGEKYACPEVFKEPGFFEDYFDDKSEAIETFSKYVKTL